MAKFQCGHSDSSNKHYFISQIEAKTAKLSPPQRCSKLHMAGAITSDIQESGYDTPSQSHGDTNQSISQAGPYAAVSIDVQQGNEPETEEFTQSNPTSSKAPTIQEIKAQSPIYLLVKYCLQRFEGLCDDLHSSQSDKAD
jgi:hypothetical protein